MKMLSLAILIGASATLAAAQNPPPQTPPTQKPTVTPVTIQGCVDRAAPQAPATYLLIDAQAGGASPVAPARGTPPVTTPPVPPKAPAHVEPRYWLTTTTSLDFSKFQNQRVEVIGIVLDTPAKPITPPIPDAPKATLQATSIKMLSTECKG